LPASAERGPRRRQILFVDDDAGLRELFSALLTSRGYQAWVACDGLEAMETLERELPDLIISDLRMPRMSGFEFCSTVRRRYPQLPLIIISGEFLSPTDPGLGIADVFLAKGNYTADTLCQTIEDLLSHPPQRKHLEVPPMWVPVGPFGEVVLTCPDCLRSVPVRGCPSVFGNPVRETECISCGAKMRYCIDGTTLKGSDRLCGALTQIKPTKPRED
jgi:CheY-like chemotaxis protein